MLTTKSPIATPVTASENVAVTVNVLLVGFGALVVRTTVGTIVSTDITFCVATILSLPAASVNAQAATSIVPFAVLLAVGVNVAV